MNSGVLEVLLVGARGLKDAHFLGSSKYYVVIRCGRHAFTSKITRGEHNRVWWNEKFAFKLKSAEREELTKLKFQVMQRDKFLQDCSVGEAMVHLGGIPKEGSQRGFIEVMPAPYNVVLKDGTYEGELKVCIKFIPNVEMDQQQAGDKQCSSSSSSSMVPELQQQPSLYRAILDFALLRVSWPKFHLFCPGAFLGNNRKQDQPKISWRKLQCFLQ